MLRVEWQKGADASRKQFEDGKDGDLILPFHVAIVLRLVLPWLGSGRLKVVRPKMREVASQHFGAVDLMIDSGKVI